VVGVLVLLAAGLWYLRRPLPTPRITAYNQLTYDGHNKNLGATDGIRLYFTQFSPNSIAQLGISGGEIARLPLAIPGQNAFLWDVSPDGSHALITTPEDGHANYSQWIVPVLGGPARRVADGSGGAFSPDGGSLIYSTVNGDIFLARTDGTVNRKLANVPPVAFGEAAFWFRWSPDRKTIRFSVGNNSRLWEMSADGSGIHPLLPSWKGGAERCCGSWTQDGNFYVFLAADQIWALDERRGLFHGPSSVPVQLTSGPIHWTPPVPGRDRNTIYVGGAVLKGELSRIDLKTGNPQPFLGGISAEEVSFSPDGKSVAYVSFPDGTLWKADRNGANRMQIAGGPDYNGIPRWSPDSKEIVFGPISPDGHFSIRRVSAADGTPQWLIPDEIGDTHDANWSPDGTKVLFGLGPPARPTTARMDLRIVDLKNRQVKIVPGSEGKWSPRWSPDGRYIAAMAGGTQPGGLPIFDFKTERWHTLPVEGDVNFPAFSSDSRFLYFLRYGHNQGVFRILVAGGKEERMVNMTDWHLTGFYGFSMSLDPTDAPLVLRDMGSNDIYALTLEVK
jgi:Tol biopolymer transport system component